MDNIVKETMKILLFFCSCFLLFGTQIKAERAEFISSEDIAVGDRGGYDINFDPEFLEKFKQVTGKNI